MGIIEMASLKRNIDEAHPFGIAENAAVCREVIRRCKRECDLLLAAHDPTIIDRFPDGIIGPK